MNIQVLCMKVKRTKIILLSLGLLTRLLFGSIEEDFKSLAEMTLQDLMRIKVNVSSVKAKNIFNTPSSVTIIDQSKIEKYNFQSIKEALETVPGMAVYQTIIDRNIPTSRGVLQNFYANKILILIDNIPTWQPIYGEGSIERININDVEKIEVLKGPASVLYGSNAYSGVINIILKNDTPNKIEGHGKIGLFYEYASGISYTNQKEDFIFFTSFHSEENQSKPYSIKNALGYEYNNEPSFKFSDFNDSKNFTLNTKYKKHSIMFNWFNYIHSFQGAHPSYLGGGGNNVNNMGILANYRFQDKIGNNLDFISNFTYDYFERFFPLSYDRVNMIDLAGDRTVGEVKFNYLKHGLNLEFGINGEIRKSFGHNTRNGITGKIIRHNLKNDDDVLEWSGFARINQSYKKLNFLVGGRYTNNINFGNNFSTRSSLLYSISKRQSIKLIFGQSFRVPTMFELYFDHPTVLGNDKLKPEICNSYEIAYLIGTQKYFLQILAYYAIYEDLIHRITPISGPPSQYQNEDQFNGYGTEIEMKFEDLWTFDGYINYNFIQGNNDELSNNYDFVPDHTISFGLYRDFKKLFVSSKGKYISSVKGHIKEIKPQISIDINVGFNSQLNNIDVRHVFSIMNITNSKMLTPEYIRLTPNINEITTNSFGRMISYSLLFNL